MKFLRVCSFLVLVCLPVFFTPRAAAQFDLIVTIEDPVLDGILRDSSYFNLPADALITRTMMETLTSLDSASGYRAGARIQSLAGLEYATNLESVDLEYEEITDFSPLASLPLLRTINLGHNSIAQVPNLAGLLELKELWLPNNEITDVTNLATSTSVGPIGINLSDNNIEDIGPLALATNIDGLVLNGNPIVDLSPLKFINLRWLNLGDFNYPDFGPLEMIAPSLISLGIENSNLESLSFLENNQSIIWLYLRGNRLTNIDVLPGLRADMVRLDIEFNYLDTNDTAFSDWAVMQQLDTRSWLEGYTFSRQNSGHLVTPTEFELPATASFITVYSYGTDEYTQSVGGAPLPDWITIHNNGGGFSLSPAKGDAFRTYFVQENPALSRRQATFDYPGGYSVTVYQAADPNVADLDGDGTPHSQDPDDNDPLIPVVDLNQNGRHDAVDATDPNPNIAQEILDDLKVLVEHDQNGFRFLFIGHKGAAYQFYTQGGASLDDLKVNSQAIAYGELFVPESDGPLLVTRPDDFDPYIVVPNLIQPPLSDGDGDGFAAEVETRMGWDDTQAAVPGRFADSDWDRMPDSVEQALGSNPWDPEDVFIDTAPFNGVADYIEHHDIAETLLHYTSQIDEGDGTWYETEDGWIYCGHIRPWFFFLSGDWSWNWAFGNTELEWIYNYLTQAYAYLPGFDVNADYDYLYIYPTPPSPVPPGWIGTSPTYFPWAFHYGTDDWVKLDAHLP